MTAIRILISLLLTLSGIAVSNAQSSKPGFWDVERGAESTSSEVRLRKQGDSSTAVDTIPISRIRLLRDVKRRIEKEAGITATFALTDMAMPNPNAFSTSSEKGNFVAINLAMLKLLGDDADALAAVIGHEYAHIALNHRDTRTQREGARQGISAILGFVLGRAGVPMAGTLSNLGTSMVSRTFSRDEERDADEKGISYAAGAGFSVEGGIRAWEQMAKSNTSLSIPFLSTHPASDERIETMRKLALNYPQRTNQVVAAVEPAPPQSNIVIPSMPSDSSSLVKPDGTQDHVTSCPGSYNAATWTNCFGEMKNHNGSKYVGEFKGGRFDGQGTYTFVDGRKYVGEWKGTFYHGQGIEYRADGSILQSGIWKEGIFAWESKTQAEQIAAEKGNTETVAATGGKSTPSSTGKASVDYMAEAKKSALILGCPTADVKVMGAENGQLFMSANCGSGLQLLLTCDQSGLCLRR